MYIYINVYIYIYIMKREGKVAKGSGRITTVRSLGHFELSHDPKWTINGSHKLNTRHVNLLFCELR